MINFIMNEIIRENFVFGIISKINIKLLITLICFAFLRNSIYGNFDSLSNQTITSEEILWLFWGIIFSLMTHCSSWKYPAANLIFSYPNCCTIVKPNFTQ